MVKPLISIIIPVFNGEKYLSEAIESILAQDYHPYEIIVVDNGSSDGSQAIARGFSEVRYHYDPIANTASARNIGIGLAKGDYIAFLDQDDTWVPHKLAKQMTFLQEHKNVLAVIGLQQMYVQEGYAKPSWLKAEFLLTPQYAYLPSALLARKSAFMSATPFNIDFSLTSDVAWFFEMNQKGATIGVLDEVLVYRRMHHDNASNQLTLSHQQLLLVIKNALMTQRVKIRDAKN